MADINSSRTVIDTRDCSTASVTYKAGAADATTAEPRCPYCGEVRLIAPAGTGRLGPWYNAKGVIWDCDVCAREWTIPKG